MDSIMGTDIETSSGKTGFVRINEFSLSMNKLLSNNKKSHMPVWILKQENHMT